MANHFLSNQGVVQYQLPETRIQPAAASQTLQLLIVEDVTEDVELITLALEAANLDFHYEVAVSLDGCRALLTHQDYDAVLADYRLPRLHAPQVLQVVHQLRPHTPFILVTGSLGEEAAVECIKTGMTDYVLKDRLYRLPTVLKRALNEAELKRQQRVAIAQIEQQAWRESVLNHITQAIRETLVLEEVLQSTVDQLQKALQVDRCLVVQPSPDQHMIVQYVSDSAQDRGDFLHRSCDLCIHFDEALRMGQQVVLHRSDAQLAPVIAEFLETYQLASALITPINYQRDYFGALTLHQTRSPRDWTPNEVSLVKAVADQCAIAISQANLYAAAQRELKQRCRIEERLRHDAFHDALTGLPNRALFLDRLNHALQIAHRPQDSEFVGSPRKFAVLFLDLDDFRIVNDSLGHDAGDFLLQVVASRLKRCLRVGDTLARTSGDEFAVLLEDIVGTDDITEVVESLQEVLRHPITLETQEIFISACIGIVIDAPSYSDAAQFLRDADTAMYQAKEKGRGRYQVFDCSMHTEVRQRLQMENDLRRALDRQEFALVYQPIVSLPSQRICGFEALIRWYDPIQAVHWPPDQFISVAEQTGLIIPIGEWVLRQACLQWQIWVQRWPDLMRSCSISINLSAEQFVQHYLIGQIEAILRESGIDSQALRLEITESVLLDNEETSLEILRQIKSRNIQIAMDDFGTGYSSLSYLLRFPKDVLKIDKSFVSNLERSVDNQEIIKTIIALGSNLGLDVVAEGIETASQAQFLLDHGCQFGQGYWFSPPLTIAEAETALEAQAHRSA